MFIKEQLLKRKIEYGSRDIRIRKGTMDTLKFIAIIGGTIIGILAGIIGIIVLVVFIVGWIIHPFLDDSPSFVYTEEVLQAKNSLKTIFVSNRFEKTEGHGRYKTFLYSYRGIRYEAELDILGTPVLHEIHAEIRCYYEYDSWNPFVFLSEKDKCRYHEIEKTPKKNMEN